jgi:hypothetical protein
MKTLQQQIEQLQANPIVGGVKWEYDYIGTTSKFLHNNNNFKIEVQHWRLSYVCYITLGDKLLQSNYYYKLQSTTLQEALLEALCIVKAKVMELAKELGYVCFDKEQMTSLRHIFNNAINHRELQYYELTKEYKQLQQYLTEQGNE